MNPNEHVLEIERWAADMRTAIMRLTAAARLLAVGGDAEAVHLGQHLTAVNRAWDGRPAEALAMLAASVAKRTEPARTRHAEADAEPWRHDWND